MTNKLTDTLKRLAQEREAARAAKNKAHDALKETFEAELERAGAENYKPHPITGSKVVLTVAHLDHA
jgi:hypothetical protein